MAGMGLSAKGLRSRSSSTAKLVTKVEQDPASRP